MCTDWPEINYTKELDTNVDQKRPETVHLWIKCSFNRYRSIKQYPMCWLGRFKQVPLCPIAFSCHCFHISTTNELRNFPFYINGIEPKGQSRMYNHGTQDDKQKHTRQKTKLLNNTGPTIQPRVNPGARVYLYAKSILMLFLFLFPLILWISQAFSCYYRQTLRFYSCSFCPSISVLCIIFPIMFCPFILFLLADGWSVFRFTPTGYTCLL